MSDEEFERKLKNARKRVAQMDRVDGFKDRQLRTIELALESGIKCSEECLFEALVMLKDINKFNA